MESICHICGRPLDKTYAVNCIRCGREIHCPTEKSLEDACCSIVTQLYVCGLAFICNSCSGQDKGKPQTAGSK